MPYISNKRPKPKPPQNNVMTISKALKAVNDNMDWTVLFIALLLVMAKRGTLLGVITLCYKLKLLCMIGFYLPTIPVLPPHEPFVSRPLSDFHCDRHYIDFPNHSYDISMIQSIRLHH